MKHLITLFAIGATSVLVADAYPQQQTNGYRTSQQYYSDDAYPSENNRGSYTNGQYYQENANPYHNQSNDRGMNYYQDNGNGNGNAKTNFRPRYH